ncbi:MAG TPA: hypothetical protein VFQ76_17695 [Longimicrobiaceae bacterium]|nr:hypothetical protein [Longimicrobiaceae bacterium]
MKPRARLLAALLALFAFSASIAEQVWASGCGPDMAGGGMSSMAGGGMSSMAGMSAAAANAGGHGDMAMPRGAHDGRHAPVPSGSDECPLQVLAGGCTLLSLPADADERPAGAPTPEARVSGQPDRAPDLLLPSSLFHPPQR